MSNINESKKHHFLYKTVNLLNGKYYVGIHSTSNLKDGYLGSGTRLRRAIRKYGKENFKLEILEFFHTRKDLAKRERELVNEALLQDPMCMNLKPGGDGGFLPEHQKLGANAGSKVLQEKLKNPVFYAEWKERMAAGLRRAYAEGTREKKGGGWNRGSKLTEEHKAKIGAANSIKQKGDKNSQYGKKQTWITNEEVNRKIERNLPIPEGWRKGRKNML
jgi:hypothetical protein